MLRGGAHFKLLSPLLTNASMEHVGQRSPCGPAGPYAGDLDSKQQPELEPDPQIPTNFHTAWGREGGVTGGWKSGQR